MKKTLALLSIILILSSSSSHVFAKGGSGGEATDSGVNAAEQAAQAEAEAAAAKAAEDAAAEKAAQDAAAAKAAQDAAVEAQAAKDAADKADADATAKERADKAVQDKAAADAAAIKASEEKVNADKAAQNAASSAKLQADTAAAASSKAEAEKKQIKEESLEIEHCGQKRSPRERISCRLTADKKTLEAEYADNYKPEACRWWDKSRSDEWNEKWEEACSNRYMREQACWTDATSASNKYRAQEVIDCLKPILNLPAKLVPIADHCQDKGEDCEKEYRENVYHLIVGRFYDAEERVEVLYKNDRLDLDQTSNALEWITQHKKDFYSANSKTQRVAVIKSFQSEWDKVKELAK